MAGDWIKMELSLPDKPEVHYIASTLNIDPDAVIGKLLRVWAWFDMHTEDGNALGVTFALIDRLANVTGFGESMQFAGWLEQKDSFLTMPNFDKHTSESAKKRAQSAKRQKRFRNAHVTQPVTQGALPREEKRRDSKQAVDVQKQERFDPREYLEGKGITDPILADFLKLRKTKSAPVTLTAIEGIEREAGKAGMSLNDALRTCIERNWQGFKAEWLNGQGSPSMFAGVK